jgi:hypothetical protein
VTTEKDEDDTNPERSIEELILDAINDEDLCETHGVEWTFAESFEEGGVLTTDRGLTIKLADGHEYQITIVRSS